MKKILISCGSLCTLIVICLLFACDKAHSDDNGTDVTEGNLRVSVFEIEKTPFASLTRASESASAVVTRLNFAVYDMSGARLKYVNQTSDNANFGTAYFQLPEGDYMVVVVGHSSNGDPTMTDPTCIKFTNAQGFTDTFLFYNDVTIGENSVEMKVSLDRIVSMCRFVVTDEFPDDVKKMRFFYTGGSGAFDATTSLGCVNSRQDVKYDVVAGKKEFDIYTFLHDEEGTIHLTVTALNAAGSELYNRSFDVPMQQNHITWLSGAFFGGSDSSSSSITNVMVNTDWAGETHLTF